MSEGGNLTVVHVLPSGALQTKFVQDNFTLSDSCVEKLHGSDSIYFIGSRMGSFFLFTLSVDDTLVAFNFSANDNETNTVYV